MSDLVSSALSRVSSIASVLSGPAVVQLDSFGFTEFEVPERMRWGGKNAGMLHKLVGGDRVLDKTGPDDEPISWSGILLGSNAKDRARQLDELRRDGGPFQLDWVGSSQMVWLRSCTFEEGFNRITYQISCEVIPEVEDDEDDDLGPANGVSDGLRQSSATSGLGKLLNDLTGSNGLGDLVSQASGVITQVKQTGAALIGTASNVSALAGAVGLHVSLGSTLAKAESVLGAGGDIASRFGTIQAAAGQAASLVGANGKLSRVVTLLGG